MIHIVGAGSGAADLITLRGARLLRAADVVVWAGSLVNPELLAECKESCVVYDSAHMTLEEVLDVMCAADARGEEVVRLHTGDPCLYGAIQEQMDALDARGVDYEVVPGVTSAIAVPAYNGIPVTHRDFCSSVHIITGHKKKDEKYDIDFEALVRTKERWSSSWE